MPIKMNHRTTCSAVAAVLLAAATTTNAVVQTYSAASGTPGNGADHPGFGFFQFDPGLWDTGLDAGATSPPAGEFAFSGSDGAFTMSVGALLNGGMTGQVGDHAANFQMDYNPAPPDRSFGSFWFGGVGNDAGPLPSTTLGNVLAYIDVLAQPGVPYEFRIESDFTSQNNGFKFQAIGTGGWQTIGGALSTAIPIGAFNAADPQIALLAAFGHDGNEITAVDDGTDPSRVPVLRIDNLTLTIAQASWNVDGSGNWSDNSRWSPVAPDGANAVAVFGNAITSPQTVTVDGERFAGEVRFNSAQPYTLGGTGRLILRTVGGGAAGLTVQSGSHSITAPVVLFNNAEASVAGGSTLTVSSLTPSAGSLTKSGGGTLRVNNVRAAALSVNTGTVQALPNGGADGVSRVGNLSIAGGAALDVADNGLVVDYTGASPIGAIASAVTSGYNGGAWTGSGLRSSNAAATPGATAVGFAEASSLFTTFPATFMGQQVDSSTVLVRYTRVGDANLDGVTGIADFSVLAANFNLSGDWVKGDFNYNGQVSIADFSLLAANFNLSAAVAGSRVAVPEPALGGFALAAMALVARRRR